MSNIKEIAQQAGVSTMTVSRYFNNPEKLSEKAKEKIKKVINEIDYQPNEIARSMRAKKTLLVGVVIPDIRNPFFNHCYYAIEEYFNKLGYSILLCNSKEDPVEELKYIKLLSARQVDGIILMPVSEESIEVLVRKKKSYVLVDRVFEGVKGNYIIGDHYKGAFDAVSHLTALGHKKVGIIKGGNHLFPYAERYRGYVAALEVCGIPLTADLVKEALPEQTTAYECMNELLSLPKGSRPTAIFACNNLMCQGAIKSIYEHGLKIPDDISIISFDPLPAHEILKPAITCVAQPVYELGEKAAELLYQKLIGEGEEDKHLVIKPELIHGDSCSSPKED
ncbi:LacI family DNA-binding transcriptional regulator [Flammeovirgaceae bacterium SG7u.111]|nr:LacI family DNA-binding transcriptional regulator [Flammeovirgaceae bacterium SG7u.132]WPO35744.1 LacI family DNA-binding transcriptional regulator [Flammeovirgaceae bacterium SG7u.111]